MQAGCFLKLLGKRVLLATSGVRTIALYSKVHTFMPFYVFFFTLSDTLLDVCGRLESESVVGAAIEGIPNLWCFEEPLLSPPSESQLAHSPNLDTPSLTVTASRITSAEGILIRDWREPIRQMVRFQNVNIRITDKPPSSSSSHTPISGTIRRSVTYNKSTNWETFCQWPPIGSNG
jgi:hypothetical protein